ncbi:hypothetical protein UA38_11860 [Photobacterium kishitanii]|uniref:Uncharacterized protein n=1 Tax=Photobacterium kishitanii TaxID=318456 RepID=A0AAX0YRL4_9GAMM|nr:hypothetical protein [Photobacterium kishitanii]KJG57064.1 hypothetical protein UA38_11860 [Photobacterium kishitanii]KJG60590.1 hypothetical protein UA42_14655 [Photobacterium kishitanii]KJG64891.1 hypothetical protein UA40_14345 [Photobacterium kishitanii]KJG68527.1 hypothetical protein UA41_16755 [Photobacterium kishitanii]PSX18318.1 hypothetical protein C0W70_15735 [Photobacterium kishitanii]
MEAITFQTDMFAEALIETEIKARSFVECETNSTSYNFDAFLQHIKPLQWQPEEVEKLREKLAKQSLGLLVDTRASDEERDDVWMWLRQDNFSEPFSYFNCLWSQNLNPIIFRDSVFDGMHRKLIELRKESGKVDDDVLVDYISAYERKSTGAISSGDFRTQQVIDVRLSALKEKQKSLVKFGSKLIQLKPQGYQLMKWLEAHIVVRESVELNPLEEFSYRLSLMSDFPREIG